MTRQRRTRPLEEVLLDNTATEDLKPLATPKDFDLVAWRSPGESGVNPSDLKWLACMVGVRSEQGEDERVERKLEVVCDEPERLGVVLGLGRVFGRQRLGRVGYEQRRGRLGNLIPEGLV